MVILNLRASIYIEIIATWWGMHKTNDTHKLVWIKIDILNNQDFVWGIDMKKSTANPVSEIKKILEELFNKYQ